MVMAILACAAPVANSIRPAAATRKERILSLASGLVLQRRSPVPRINMPGIRLLFHAPVRVSLIPVGRKQGAGAIGGALLQGRVNRAVGAGIQMTASRCSRIRQDRWRWRPRRWRAAPTLPRQGFRGASRQQAGCARVAARSAVRWSAARSARLGRPWRRHDGLVSRPCRGMTDRHSDAGARRFRGQFFSR